MGGENALKSREVSAMIRQGFIADPTLSFSPSRTFSSPPPPPPSTRPSQTQTQTQQTQTLFEMMSEEQNRDAKVYDDRRRKMQDRVSKLLEEAPFGGGDVKLTVVGRDGFRVSMEVHKGVLAGKSRFFAEKLRCDGGSMSHSVEISDCDDVEVYVEAVVLMHCEDLMRRLRFMGQEGVSKVLSLLKVLMDLCLWIELLCCIAHMFSRIE